MSLTNIFRNNPHLWLAVLLFVIGGTCIATGFSIISGALFGAGASLLGSWISELNSRRAITEDKARREAEARRYLAPELNRTIERVLYIHERAIPNFICASTQQQIAPNDLQDDFIPYMPSLYPTTPQFRDLSGDDAVALIAFYDSLHALERFVLDWWEREGQLRVNIFNMIMQMADKSLSLAEVCIRNYKVEEMCPPPYQSWDTLSARIARSRAAAKQALEHHIAKAGSNR